MRELTAREMRKGYGAIIEALERDGEVVLTHHGKPYAKIVPLGEEREGSGAIAEMRRKRLREWAVDQRRFLAEQPELPPFDWDSFRADR
jgi:antitoxin (DNA-binding transcriptional repressor) of toxin-antitoxin stability system